MDILNQIRSGDFDSSLDTIIRTAVARRRYLQDVKGAQNQQEFVAGTRVRIISGIRPKYLIGLTGTVADDHASRSGDLMVEFDSGQFTGRFGHRVSIPASCLGRM